MNKLSSKDIVEIDGGGKYVLTCPDLTISTDKCTTKFSGGTIKFKSRCKFMSFLSDNCDCISEDC